MLIQAAKDFTPSASVNNDCDVVVNVLSFILNTTLSYAGNSFSDVDWNTTIATGGYFLKSGYSTAVNSKIYFIPAQFDIADVNFDLNYAFKIFYANEEITTLTDVVEVNTSGIVNPDVATTPRVLQKFFFTDSYFNITPDIPPQANATYTYQTDNGLEGVLIINILNTYIVGEHYEPYKITYKFATKILSNNIGQEQRIAEFRNPLESIEYPTMTIDAEDNLERFNKYIDDTSKNFTIPLWHFARPLLLAVGATDSVIPVNLAYYDMLYAGADIMIMVGDEIKYDYALARIDSINVGGNTITLTNIIGKAFSANALVVPTLTGYLDDNKISITQMPEKIQKITYNVIKNVRSDVTQYLNTTLKTFNSLLLLEIPPRVFDMPTMDFDYISNAKLYQAGYRLTNVTAQSLNRINFTCKYFLDSVPDYLYMLKFVNSVKGMLKPFYINLNNNSYAIIDQPVSGAGNIVIKDNGYKNYLFDKVAYRGIGMFTNVGWVYRLVNSINTLLDGTIALNFTETLPIEVTEIYIVTQLYKVRLNTDSVTFNHERYQNITVDLACITEINN